MDHQPVDLELFAEDLQLLTIDPVPDAVSAAATATRSSFSCMGSASTATCAASMGTAGTASSF